MKTGKPLFFIVAAMLSLSIGVPFLAQIRINLFSGLNLKRIHPLISGAPNVILIVVDTLRYTAPGHPDQIPILKNRPMTPGLYGISQHGVSFTNAYANSNWTPPSTTTILSSLYESQHGVNQVLDVLPPIYKSVASEPYPPGSGVMKWLPQILHEHGYNTAFFSANPVVSEQMGYAGGFNYVRELWKDFWRPDWVRFPFFYPYLYVEYLFGAKDYNKDNNDEVASYSFFRAIKRFAGEARSSAADKMYERVTEYLDYMTGLPAYGGGKNHKFFLYVHMMDPHSPYRTPFRHRCRISPCQEIFYAPAQKYYFLESPPAKGESQHLFGCQHKDLIDRYNEEIEFVDEWIGKLVDYLKEKNIFANTLLIITADHGEAFFEHGHYGHGVSVHDEEVRIPMIITWPDKILKPLVVEEPVSLVDIAPTIIDVVGEKFDGQEKYNVISTDGMVGKSLLPLMRGQKEDRVVKIETQEQDTGEWMRRTIENQP